MYEIYVNVKNNFIAYPEQYITIFRIIIGHMDSPKMDYL